jgi:2-isopropylmalate synthase
MSDIIYDWNQKGERLPAPLRDIEVHDETLRDGIQSPSLIDPPISAKEKTIRLLTRSGVASVNVGLPGAGPRAVADSEHLVKLIRDEGLNIRPGCAARTHPNDIQPIIEISDRTGVPVEAMMFLGSSPIRMYAEGWDEDRLEKLTRDAVRMAVTAGIPASFVTEDTVRSSPETLRRLFIAAIDEGADRLVLCDTVGHSTPTGVYNIVRFSVDLLKELGVRDRVKLDWHGHDDRGLSLINAMAAMEAGVDRLHGTVMGVGERVGNTPVDLLLVNLKLLGHDMGDPSALSELVTLISENCDWPVPPDYPVFGRDAFRTGTGVHAAAVIKAAKRGDDALADMIYSGVPASWFGRKQEIEVGHMSGLSNIKYWLESRDSPCTDKLVDEIFTLAKSGSTTLTEDAIMTVVTAQ